VKLLEVQSSPRGESSDSIALTKSFIEACKSDNTSIVVDTLNVWHEQLPELRAIVAWKLSPRNSSRVNVAFAPVCAA
jgi:FMN-dependent NADH-azoreductase